MKITASLVLYRNAPEIFEPAIESIIQSDGEAVLSIVDNSPAALHSHLFAHPRVRYHHNGANIGFGAAHNKAFSVVCRSSDVHFIINPDVTFEPTVLRGLAAIFAREAGIAAAMPAVFDEKNQQQNLCKKLPSPFQLIVRRFIPFAPLREAIDAGYEFRNLPSQGLIDIPNLSGCFLAFRASAFAEIGGFDERYFMYMEDIDLVRRLGDHGRTVYVPTVRIYHGHARGSYRLGRLMLIHIRSAFHYFNKWGWLRDPTRTSRNARTRRALGR